MYMVGKGLAGGVHTLELELRTRKKKVRRGKQEDIELFLLSITVMTLGSSLLHVLNNQATKKFPQAHAAHAGKHTAKHCARVLYTNCCGELLFLNAVASLIY